MGPARSDAPTGLDRWLGLRPTQAAAFGRLFAQCVALGLAFISFYSVSNARFLSTWGAAYVPWIYIAAAAATVAIALVFAAAERRLGLRIAATTALVAQASGLAFLWAGLVFTPEARWLAFVAPVLYRVLWVLGNLAVWSQANALLDLRQVKRLTPLLTLGLVLGILTWGIFHGGIVGALGVSAVVGVDALLLGAAASLAATMPAGAGPAPAKERSSRPLAPAERRFTAALLTYAAVATVAAYTVDYAFLTAVGARYADPSDGAGFLARYLGGVTLAVVVATGAIVGPVLRRFGIRGGLAANPFGTGVAIVSAGLSLLLGAPEGWIFALVVLAKGANETAVPAFTGPSVRTAVQALPRENRVRTLSWYDGVVSPLAVGLTGVALLGIQRLGGVGLGSVLWFLLALLVVWAGAAIAVGRRYPELVAERLQPPRTAPALVPPDVPLDLLPAPAALLVLRAGRHAAHLAPVDALEPGLRHPDRAVRAATARALASFGPAARPILEASLAREEALEVRVALLPALADVSEGAADRVLLGALDGPTAGERDVALGALLRHGGYGALGAALARVRLAEPAGEAAERARTALALGYAGRPAGSVELAALLQDPDPMVRRAAIAAVGACGARSLLPGVLPWLADPGVARDVRACVRALGPAAEHALAVVARDPAPGLPVRGRALRLLGRLRAPIGGPALARAVALRGAASNPALRPVALRALAALGPAATTDELLRPQLQLADALLAHGPTVASSAPFVAAVERAARQAAEGLLALASHAELRRPAEILAGRRTGDRALALEAVDARAPRDIAARVSALVELVPSRRAAPDAVRSSVAALAAVPLLPPLLRAALMAGHAPLPPDGDAPAMPDNWERALALLGNAALATLDDDALALLASHARERPWAAGERLFGEGDPSGPVYLVVRGTVRVEQSGVALRTLGPGALFGELDLFSPGPRSADVVAVEDGSGLLLDGEVLGDVLDEQPALARAFLADLTERLRRTQ